MSARGIDPLSRSHERKHLIVPETGFGIFTQDFFLETGLMHGKKVNAERFMESSAIKEHRQRVNFAEKMAAELLDEAYLSLEKAKGMHDELEKFYIDAMNFEKVGEKTEEIIKTLVDAFSKTA